MIKFLKLSVCLFFASTICAQAQVDTLFRKGTMFAFWGWNRAGYSKSTIKFQGPGYDFTLYDVVAHDRQSEVNYHNYLQPDRVTIPQTNTKIGYFIKDNLALVLALDHMKYVMDQNQTVRFSGHIDDPKYAAMVQNNKVDLTDEQFLTFEHTDGLNYINIGIEKYKEFYQTKNINVNWAYGGGGGVLLPKTNAKLFGFPRSDRFHLAGYGVDLRTNLNAVFWHRIMAKVEGKLGYINMPDIRTRTSAFKDKAAQHITFAELDFGVGYVFHTIKKK